MAGSLWFPWLEKMISGDKSILYTSKNLYTFPFLQESNKEKDHHSSFHQNKGFINHSFRRNWAVRNPTGTRLDYLAWWINKLYYCTYSAVQCNLRLQVTGGEFQTTTKGSFGCQTDFEEQLMILVTEVASPLAQCILHPFCNAASYTVLRLLQVQAL